MRRGNALCLRWLRPFWPVCALAATGAGCLRTTDPEPAPTHPEPPPTPLAERESPYGMTWFHTIDDEERTRSFLQTLADMGARQPLALIYWWRWDTKGFDYVAKGYRPEDVDEAYQRALDYYVNTSVELGLQPCFRVGSFRSFKGLYHPADPSGSVEAYADWLRFLANRYRGKVHLWMLGDEENRGYPFGWTGDPDDYMNKFFIPAATGVREGDPDALITIGSVSSAPATDWILQVIDKGLPRYADGVSGNFSYPVMENRREMEDLVRRVRQVWPACRFFGHNGYAENLHGIHDARQAGITAQCMFIAWDLGWDTAAYYLYRFSKTADTRQNYGLIKTLPGEEGKPAEFSDAWRAYQTIANTFYDRSKLATPDFAIRARQSDRFEADDGFSFTLAPTDVELRAFIRQDRQLLIYLACPRFNEPRDGRWDILIDTPSWRDPKRIPLLDYTAREPVPHHEEDGVLVLESVSAGLQPAILVLRRVVE